MKAEAVAVALGGETVLEDSVEMFRRDAQAVIGNLNPHGLLIDERRADGQPQIVAFWVATSESLAFLIRLMRIWSTFCFSNGVGGISRSSRTS